MSDNAAALKVLLDRYATPPPGIVQKKGGKGFQPEYVSHAELTKVLIGIDPEWSWGPQEWDPRGGPLVLQRGDRYVMWGHLTLLGRTLPCVGTCKTNQDEIDKELIGDLLVNGAYRFGIHINLWARSEASQAERAEAERQPESGSVVWDEARWKGLAERLRALPDIGRNVIVGKLTNLGLFEDRKPCTPFTSADLDHIEKLIVADPVDDGPDESVPEGPSPGAVEVVAAALSIKDPLNPPEGYTVEPWMWELAEVTDLDAHDWKATATAAHMRQKDILDRAKKIAEEAELPEPDRLTDIHGLLADELRAVLISDPSPF